MAAFVQVFGRRNAKTIHALGGRRPKSAKARNRGVWGTEGVAGAMGIRPARMAFKNAARKSKGRRKAA